MQFSSLCGGSEGCFESAVNSILLAAGKKQSKHPHCYHSAEFALNMSTIVYSHRNQVRKYLLTYMCVF